MGDCAVSDLTLVEAFQFLGDPTHIRLGEAWERIHKEVKALAPAVLNSMRVLSHDREDIVSDVTLKLHEGDLNRNLDSEGHVRRYIRTALKHHALDRIKRQGRQELLPEIESEPDSGRRTGGGESAAEDRASATENEAFLPEAIATALAAQGRRDARANLERALRELEGLARGRLSRNQLYVHESGVDEPVETELRKARDRVHQRHSRGRKRFLSFVRKRAGSPDPDAGRWAELEDFISGRWR